MVDITGIKKEDVLSALYNASKNSKYAYSSCFDAIYEVAINPALRFDYVAGRLIKCDISGDTFDEKLFDENIGKDDIIIYDKTLDELLNEGKSFQEANQIIKEQER